MGSEHSINTNCWYCYYYTDHLAMNESCLVNCFPLVIYISYCHCSRHSLQSHTGVFSRKQEP